MRKIWWTLLLLAVVVVGAATVVQARGPMGGGRGMMMGNGYGMMMGGNMPCQNLNGNLSEEALAERLQLQLTMAKSHVEFWSKATATDAANQEWIAARLTMAQQHLAALEAQAAK